jgi:tRNA threonylcarbamoyladenosine biosynthesis protein TsaB
MRVLAIDTALAVAVVGLVDGGGQVVREASSNGGRGLVERLPALVAGVLGGERVDLIGVVVGPGSFTGIRAGLALGHGLAIGFGCAVVGVTVREALSVGLAVGLEVAGPGAFWVATDALRGGVFLEGDGPPRSVRIEELVAPSGGLLVAGDRGAALAAHLGGGAWLAARLVPSVLDVASAARARFEGRLGERAALPLYVDAPEVSRPAVAPRPPPA